MRFLLFFLLLACGPGGGKDASPKDGAPDYSMTVPNRVNLPDCGPDNQGQLVYLHMTKEFVYCNDGDWQDIDVAGPQGKQGAEGEKGDRGEKGEAGEDLQAGLEIAARYECAESDDVDPALAYIVYVTAVVLEYADGSHEIQCDVDLTSSDGDDRYYQSRFYPTAEVGSALNCAMYRATASYDIAQQRVTYANADSPPPIESEKLCEKVWPAE